MAELASIDAQLADIAIERIDLLERERKLLARRVVIFTQESGSEAPIDLRTNARRRREIEPLPLASATPRGVAEAKKDLERNETRRRTRS